MKKKVSCMVDSSNACGLLMASSAPLIVRHSFTGITPRGTDDCTQRKETEPVGLLGWHLNMNTRNVIGHVHLGALQYRFGKGRKSEGKKQDALEDNKDALSAQVSVLRVSGVNLLY